MNRRRNRHDRQIPVIKYSKHGLRINRLIDIPEAREEILLICQRNDVPDDAKETLLWVERMMWRKPAVHRAETTAEPMTHEKVIEAWELHRAHPTWGWRRIGAEIGVDGGRISEAIAGFRKGAPPERPSPRL